MAERNGVVATQSFALYLLLKLLVWANLVEHHAIEEGGWYVEGCMLFGTVYLLEFDEL